MFRKVDRGLPRRLGGGLGGGTLFGNGAVGPDRTRNKSKKSREYQKRNGRGILQVKASSRERNVVHQSGLL